MADEEKDEKQPRGTRRDRYGCWVKGETGNPAGPAKDITRKMVQGYAQQCSMRAVDILMDVAETSKDPRARVAACIAVLDRAFGKPVSTLALEDPNENVQKQSTNALVARLPDALRLLQGHRTIDMPELVDKAIAKATAAGVVVDATLDPSPPTGPEK